MDAKAKRGQVCIIHTSTRNIYQPGFDGPNKTHSVHAAIVRGVTREGEITRFESLDGSPVRRLDRIVGLEAKYAINGDFDHAAAIAAVQARGSCEFETVEAAKEFMRPFLK